MSERPLLEAAARAMELAYCPYSRLRVGAALRAAGGGVFSGCNIENGSYGLTLCAERNAVSQALLAGHRAFEALAIVADSNNPLTPCGACRQVLAEFCTRDLPIYVSTSRNMTAVSRYTLGELLPHAFRMNGEIDG